MSGPYPQVPLSGVVQHRKEFIEISDDESYKRCRVQLHAKGVVLRDLVGGQEIKTKRQQVCRANDFLVAEIDAKSGGYGIVPPDLAGSVVSSHYFLFEVLTDRMDVRFLNYCLRMPRFHDQVVAKGSTNYAAVRPADVLAYLIPLPPLDEQRRIVARIEALAGKIEAVRRLRREAIDVGALLLRSVLTQDPAARQLTPLSQLVRQRSPDVTVSPDESYHFAGVYSFGRGVFAGPIKRGAETSYKILTRLRTNDFVYPKLMAWEGALGIVPPGCSGLCVSPEFPVFAVDEDLVLPEVLDVYFRTPSVWPLLSGESTGTNVRRRRLNPSSFLAFKMPIPSMRHQHQLREVKARIDAMKCIQDQGAAELDALLPAVLEQAFSGGL